MFEYLKVKNHKGITSDVELRGLGHINILCGKNNSGKTSILEVIGKKWDNRENFAIGRKFSKDEFLEHFNRKADAMGVGYRNKAWFDKYCDFNIEHALILYTDTIDDHIKEVKEFRDRFILNPGERYEFDLKNMFDNFFSELISNYKPILIIPKRSLEIRTPITVQQSEFYSEGGRFITNLLFDLKNKTPDSPEAEKYKEIYTAFEQITGCSFSVSKDRNDLVLNFNILGVGKWVEGDASGLGLHDVLVLITFIFASDATLFLIEEPENHLHPEMQKNF